LIGRRHLLVPQLAVQTVHGQQLCMTSALHNAPFAEHQDLLGMGDGFQAMGR
jgi:hypothetical protein